MDDFLRRVVEQREAEQAEMPGFAYNNLCAAAGCDAIVRKGNHFCSPCGVRFKRYNGDIMMRPERVSTIQWVRNFFRDHPGATISDCEREGWSEGYTLNKDFIARIRNHPAVVAAGQDEVMKVPLIAIAIANVKPEPKPHEGEVQRQTLAAARAQAAGMREAMKAWINIEVEKNPSESASSLQERMVEVFKCPRWAMWNYLAATVKVAREVAGVEPTPNQVRAAAGQAGRVAKIRALKAAEAAKQAHPEPAPVEEPKVEEKPVDRARDTEADIDTIKEWVLEQYRADPGASPTRIGEAMAKKFDVPVVTLRSFVMGIAREARAKAGMPPSRPAQPPLKSLPAALRNIPPAEVAEVKPTIQAVQNVQQVQQPRPNRQTQLEELVLATAKEMKACDVRKLTITLSPEGEVDWDVELSAILKGRVQL